MGLDYISLEITDKCNNDCLYCTMPGCNKTSKEAWEDNEGSLSKDDIIKIINNVRADSPLRSVAISGGEPTLRADFPLIVSNLVDIGLSPVVITNGTGLTKNLLNKLPQGITFQVTLLSRTHQTHDRLAGADVFHQIVENASFIDKQGSRLIVSFVATKLNALEVYRVAELGLALGSEEFVYQLFSPCSTNWYSSSMIPTTDVFDESLELLQSAVIDLGIDATCNILIPPCTANIIQRYPSVKFCWCPRNGNERRGYAIDRAGLVRPCVSSPHVLGDLRREGFAEIVSRDTCASLQQPASVACHACIHPLKDKCRNGCTIVSHTSQNFRDYLAPVYSPAREIL